MSHAFEGVTALDMTSGVAGPFCTKVLAGLGVEVIKIERPRGGDPSRHHGSFYRDVPHPETSTLFLDLNMGKMSLTLDVGTPEGARIVRELAKSADIVVEDFKPGTADRLGVGYGDLEAINQRVVYTSVSGFGQTGPYRDYLGSDMVFYATGGEMCSTGEPDRHPVRLANYVISTQAGNMAAVATLMAHRAARTSGAGQHVDVSAFETAASSVDRRLQHLMCYIYNGRIATRADNTYAMYPTGVYACADGFFHIVGGGTRFFHRTTAMLGMPELVDDPRFNTTEALLSQERKEEFDTIFVPWAFSKTKAEILEAARQHKVYASPMLTTHDIFHDANFEARGFFREVDHPATGRHRYPGPPVKMDRIEWRVAPAPLLGEHNREILVQRLGYSLADLARLRQAGVI